nr:type III-A CRISPR-associated RAMP protein Csm5 [Candidatus Sigynarchaeota archaeon]
MTGNLSITGMSPVHVGSGKVYSQLDYIAEGQTVHVLDFDSILAELNPSSIDDLTREIEENFKGNIWKGNVSEFLGRYKLEWKKHVEHTIPLRGTIGDNEIRRFIKTGNEIYIPGSSIKGAIRTAILSSILNAAPQRVQQVKGGIVNYFNDREVNRLLQGRGAQDDLLRALQVSDCIVDDPTGSTTITAVDILHLRKPQDSIPMFYEVLKEHFSGHGSIKIDAPLVASGNVNAGAFKLSKDNVIKALNDFSHEIVKHELETLASTGFPAFKPAIGFYLELDKQLKGLQQGEFIARLGMGSSSIAVTLYLVLRRDRDILEKILHRAGYFTFNERDSRNPDEIISQDGRDPVLINRSAKQRPKLGETWYCKIKRDRNRHLVLATPIERINDDIIHPVTRKLAASAKASSGNWDMVPMGWVRGKWT